MGGGAEHWRNNERAGEGDGCFKGDLGTLRELTWEERVTEDTSLKLPALGSEGGLWRGRGGGRGRKKAW